MKTNRSFILFVIFLFLMAIFPTILYLIGGSQPAYHAEVDPKDVLKNYFLAIHNQAAELAYSYLANEDGKPTLDEFAEVMQNRPINAFGVGVEIGETIVSGDEARVNITLIYLRGTFPGEFRREQQTATLVLEQDEWKIDAGPVPYWFWDWYGPPVKPEMEPVPVRE